MTVKDGTESWWSGAAGCEVVTMMDEVRVEVMMAYLALAC